MGKRTPLFDAHLAAGAKLVDFAGWDMPLHYGSQLREHEAVRSRAGVFDVSHMTVIDVRGEHATAWLQYLMMNDAGRLEAGEAQYSALLNEEGGVLDDLIVYRMGEDYRLVLNCATRDKDRTWLTQQAAGWRVDWQEREDLAILAVSGPASLGLVREALETLGCDAALSRAAESLKYFRALERDGWMLARTGYTGEKGLEILLPAEQVQALWDALLALDIRPVGLGARDSLRLEAGMNLYGNDMDEGVSPLSANMERHIAWEPPGREFIGRDALERLRQGEAPPRLVGLVLDGRGVLRHGQPVLCERAGEEVQGLITSGGYSPTLKCSIALARLPAGATAPRVDLRGQTVSLRLVEPRFVRGGGRASLEPLSQA